MTNPGEFTRTSSGFDHYPRFKAYEENLGLVEDRINNLLSSSEPTDIEFDDPDHRLQLTQDEVSRLWGAFPPSARLRSLTTPTFSVNAPLWFTAASTKEKVEVTDQPELALSPTSNAMANATYIRDSEGFVRGTKVINLFEIPDNGFDRRTRRLVQAGVIVHELGHTIVAPELHNPSPEYGLILPSGKTVNMREWFSLFIASAEHFTPVSHYSSAYRNADNTFYRHPNGMIDGIGVNEELTELITASILGFCVKSDGIDFNPFSDRPDILEATSSYLHASLPINLL